MFRSLNNKNKNKVKDATTIRLEPSIDSEQHGSFQSSKLFLKGIHSYHISFRINVSKHTVFTLQTLTLWAVRNSNAITAHISRHANSNSKIMHLLLKSANPSSKSTSLAVYGTQWSFRIFFWSDTLIVETYIFVIKINSFRGGVTNVSTIQRLHCWQPVVTPNPNVRLPISS